MPRRGDASLPDGGHELASDRAEAESDVECRETHEDIVDFQGGFDDTQRPFHLAESREKLYLFLSGYLGGRWDSAIGRLMDIILAFPIAFYIAKRATKHRELLLMLVVFPLWSSYLVRAFAWKTILGTNGILNSFLLWTGVVDQPVTAFLYSKTAMYITFSQVWLPFMILPLYTIIDRMPDSLLEASSDLGSNWFQTFRRVVLPLSLPGILAGSLSVFSLTMGDYITPSLIGGSPGTELIGGIIADQFGIANNWPLGAALILPVLAIISIFLLIANRAGALGRGEPG